MRLDFASDYLNSLGDNAKPELPSQLKVPFNKYYFVIQAIETALLNIRIST